MKRVILLSVVILLICLGYSFADVPCKINYQGRLIEDNVPVNEPVDMVFELYPSETATTFIWDETHNNVPVHNGLFRVVLDLSSIEQEEWIEGQELWLKVTVGGEPLSPREQIYAYPYAINTHFLEGHTTAHFLDISESTQTKKGGLNIEGNVGIGTTGPGQKLTVVGTVESTSGGFKFPDATTQTTASKVINCYFAITSTDRQTIASIDPVAINGLSITLTPVSANSKFLIMATVNGTMNYVCSTLIYRNGTKLLTHTGNRNEPGSQVTTYGSGSNSYMNQHHIVYLDSPNTTAEITYDVRHTSGYAGVAYTTYVNDRSPNDMRTPSTLTILEFAN